MGTFNVFDQFDDPKSKAAPIAAAPSGPNVFDQFDAKPTAPAAAAAGPAPGLMQRIMAAIHPIVSGAGAGVLDVAGTPITATNDAVNLGKSAIEGGYLATGHLPPTALDPIPNAKVPLTADWLKAKAEQYMPGSTSDPNHPIQHLLGELAGPGGAGMATEKIAATLPDIAGAAGRALDTDPLGTSGAAGFKATPTGTALRNPTQQPGIVPRAVEAIAGPGSTAQNNAANTANATRLAGQQMGLGESVTKITPPDLITAKAAPGAVYDAMGAKLNDFTPSPNMMNQLRDAAADQSVQASPAGRTAANKILSTIDTNKGSYSGADIVADISKLRESPNTRPIANMLDQEIGRQLQAKGDGKGLQQLLDARQKFAQIYTVQDALDGGQVDAQAIGKVHRDNPNLLTGNVRLIGTAAQELPADVKLPTQATPSGALDVIKDLLRNGTLAGPLARKLMRSDTWQSMFGPGPKADATAASYFPKFGEKPPAGDAPLTLTKPEGQVGRVLPSTGSPRGAQGELPVPQNPRPLIDLSAPEGAVGRPTPVQGNLRVPGLQDPIHNGEPLPPGPGSISGAPMASREASDLIRPLGEAFQPHQKELFPPNNVRAPKTEKPKGMSDKDWNLLTKLGFGE